jgi:Cu(I)/Ag(I) efflux system membrane fusion protein
MEDGHTIGTAGQANGNTAEWLAQKAADQGTERPAVTADAERAGGSRRTRRWRRSTFGVCLVAALALGFAIGRRSSPARSPPPGRVNAAPSASSEAYTCSMHPHVRLDRPGKCPVCGMPLVREEQRDEEPRDVTVTAGRGARSLQLSDHARAMANVETTPVTRRELSHELRTVGKVQYNESSLATVTARVDGYAERLYVNFTGVQIRAGDHLAEVYSPALEVAQADLLLALRDGLGAHAESARAKLKRWGLTDAQLAELTEKRKLTDRVTLVSPITGTVIEKSIVEHSAFKAGEPLYRVANLDTVWVYLDVYESDLPWVRFGQEVELTTEALPGRSITGRVTFVQPTVSEETRTVRVPVHVDNGDHALKPGMYVSAVVRARLAADGTAAATGMEGKYSCPMHPQVLRDAAGQCPVCDMPLERVPGDATSAPTSLPDDAAALPMAVPASAILDSGTRRIVYVEHARGMFEAREVSTGPRTGQWVPVLSGLAEEERVVVRGGFLIDSQFQITGRPSLFYPGGAAAAGSGAHRHGAEKSAEPSGSSAPVENSAPAPNASPSAGGHRH